MAELWTREQFEAYYAGGDIEPNVRRGRLSIECHEVHDDGYEECHGWKMTSVQHLDVDVDLYHNTPEEVVAALRHRSELIQGWDIADMLIERSEG